MDMKPLRSALYECRVMHHRLAPKQHRFRYRMFYFLLDLDELDEVARRVRGFSHNRRNLYQFRDSDHLTMPGLEKAGLRENLTAWLATQEVTLPADARIVLLTLPRMMGYIFNPVSFYFCEDAAGAPLCSVVQVGNTFREMKPYLIRLQDSVDFYRLITPKHFYVSPFSSLDISFDFKVHLPGKHLEIHIDDRDGDRRVLLTALTGKRVPLTSGRLAWLTLKCPLVTLKVISAIHWEALRLWIKRIPWFRKAAQREQQRDVMKPHHSLTSPPHD